MDHRIGSVSLVATSTRQTPNNEFGLLLARGVARGSSAALGAASAIIPGGAVISAAVSQTALSASAAVPSRLAASAGAPVAIGGASAPAVSGSEVKVPDGLEGQRELMMQNQQWTAQYLTLQNEMQRESREFTAVSNILKVRHESSKTAINNIR